MEHINLKRMGVLVTSICTLKCKLCLMYAPYYDKPEHISLEELSRDFSNFFRIINSVDIFTISGGEPLTHPNLLDIFKLVFEYESQINISVDMVINNTISINDDLLVFFEKNKDKINIICSDYGVKLSKHYQKNIENLQNRGINFRISKFHGSTKYYDGWLDFTDHSVKWHNIEERDFNAQKCIHRTGKYFIINNGEIHCCSRGFWRSTKGIIPKIKGEYVELLNENISIEEKRQDLLTMLSLPSSSSCACCPGFSNELPRHKPAEQL